MDSRKVAGLFLVALFLTGGVAALSINIELFDFGGNESASGGNNTSTDNSGDDQRFSYGGEDSDQITDKEGVKKSLMEQIVGAVVDTLFG